MNKPSEPNEAGPTDIDKLGAEPFERPRADYAARYNRRRSSLMFRSHQEDWERLIFSIALAGGVYPLCAAACISPWFAYMTLTYGLPTEGFLGLGIGLTMSFFVGFVYALFVSMPVCGVVALGCWLLDWRPSLINRGAFAGGMTAYLCTLPVSLSAFGSVLVGHAPPVEVFLLFLAPVLVLACFVGQVYGARSGLVNDAYQAFEARKNKEDAGQLPKPGRPQFRIRQMLALTALVSVLLTLLRVTGLLTAPMVLATTAWLMVQLAGRRPAIAIAKRLLRRRGRGLAVRPRGPIPTRRSPRRFSPQAITGDQAAEL